VDLTIRNLKKLVITSKKAGEKMKELDLARMDEAYIRDCMRRAIALARIAGANGDTPVGSFIIRNRRIIAEGFEAVRKHMDISGHAELIAIRNACSALQTLDLSGCTLYTTAEPCLMCSYAVRQSHISKVIIGGMASKAGGISSHHPILVDAEIAGWGEPPDIITGVLEGECLALRSQALPAGALARNEVDL
jgi:tRNA(adenine34) deaminase